MRFEAIEIERDSKYSFIVGTAEKPDQVLRERIRSQIGEAMEALGREPDSYSVSIVQNEEPEEIRDKAYPELRGSRDYLLFAMLRSSKDSAESFSARELEEQKEEIARGIFPPRESRIALVLLYDSSLGLLVTKMPSMAEVVSYIDRVESSRRSGRRY